MKNRVRIKDIAEKAGVSTGTVDRVLHNRGKVAPDVKENVLAVIEELGYQRNLLASALAYNHNLNIVSLLPNPEADPYWKQSQAGVQEAIRAVQHYGFNLTQLFFEPNKPMDFSRLAKQVLNNPPDGLLFPPIFFQESLWLLNQCQEKNIPTVIINTDIKGGKPLSYIGQDSYQSGVLGARLLDFGLNDGQTVCILNLDYETKDAHHLIYKERGFKDYFKNSLEKKIEILSVNFESFHEKTKLQIFSKKLLAENPKLGGIFITNSRAYKFIDSIADKKSYAGIKVVGFDLLASNIDYLKSNAINFLINQNAMNQGYLGIMSLFKHLVQKESVERQQYLPLDIVVKENIEYYIERNKVGIII